MSIRIIFFLSSLSILFSCVSKSEKLKEKDSEQIVNNIIQVDTNNITVTNSKCYGIYKGVEFNSDKEKSDVAHQFSNSMCKLVGDQLKKLYKEGNFSKVDFDHIIMTTEGMNDGDNYVEYYLEIPFTRVENKCQAATAFDHSGGWNHYPAISIRKKALLKKGRTTSMDGNLDISRIKTTKEGLQEFWIQWKHKDLQSACK